MVLETNVIYNMDCLEGMKQIDDNSVDLIITDPPYGIKFQSNRRKVKFNRLIGDDNLAFAKPFIEEAYRILKNNAHFYCFTRWDVYDKWKILLEKHFDIKNCLVIKRRHHGMGDLNYSFAFSYEMCIFSMKGRRRFNKTDLMKKSRGNHPRFRGDTSYKGFVTRFPDLIDWIPSGEFNLNMVHPTQKTTDICSFFISISFHKNDLILDPFMGSGTTAVSCRQLNRNFIGFEISKEYCDIALKRLRQKNIFNFKLKDKLIIPKKEIIKNDWLEKWF